MSRGFAAILDLATHLFFDILCSLGNGASFHSMRAAKRMQNAPKACAQPCLDSASLSLHSRGFATQKPRLCIQVKIRKRARLEIVPGVHQLRAPIPHGLKGLGLGTLLLLSL